MGTTKRRRKSKPTTAALAAAHDPSAAPHRSLRPKVRPVGRTAAGSDTRAAVEKVVVERTITEDIVARDSTATATRPAKEQHRFQVPRAPARERALAGPRRPKGRPKKLRTALPDTSASSPARQSARGSACGVRGIRGQAAGTVRGKGACGIRDAVRLSEVDGVLLTREALIGCDTARALYGWVRDQARPIVGRKGGGLAKLQVIAGYSCRTRNSRKGARLSEHAKGNALDIAGFVLKDGSTLSVQRDWRSGQNSKTLKRLHKSACGPFGTVLGPNADRYHQNHFHFDVARYRSGAYCK